MHEIGGARARLRVCKDGQRDLLALHQPRLPLLLVRGRVAAWTDELVRRAIRPANRRQCKQIAQREQKNQTRKTCSQVGQPCRAKQDLPNQEKVANTPKQQKQQRRVSNGRRPASEARRPALVSRGRSLAHPRVPHRRTFRRARDLRKTRKGGRSKGERLK
eukprot:6192332-Pleurochrysis_carterae.AAC.1